MHRQGPRDTGARSYHHSARMTVEEIDDQHNMQEAKGGFMKDETRQKIERYQNYGMTSIPKKGEKDKMPEAIVMFPGGNRSHPVIIAMDDVRYRLNDGMKEGEVAYHDHQAQQLYLREKGITIWTDKDEVHIQKGKAHAIFKEGKTKLYYDTLTITITSDKIYLGKEGILHKVMTEDGPSERVRCVINETDEAAPDAPRAKHKDHGQQQGGQGGQGGSGGGTGGGGT